MKRPLRVGVSLVFLIAMLMSGPAFAQLGARVPNWSAPQSGSHKLGIQGDIGFGGSALVPVDPCRIVDTRLAAGTFGGPALVAGSPRNFPLLSGPCTGLPPVVLAYSLNITATNALGTGFILIYPQGGSQPVVSTLNYVAGQTIANAAIVPAGTSSGITVIAGVAGTDLLIDINGYFVGNGSIAALNPGEYVGWQGNVAGGVTFGWNTSTAAGSSGVRGLETAVGHGVSGVQGEVGLINFVGPFVHGDEGVTGINTFSGVLGMAEDRAVVGVLLSTAGVDLAEGWSGKSGGSATNFFGLEGVLFSTTGFGSSAAAGVRGVDSSLYFPTATVFPAVGVLGDSLNSYGVLGRSRFVGVLGGVLNSSDGLIAYGILGTTFGTASDATTGPWGVFSQGNFGAAGVKHFVEPHPSDPKKVILYSAIEGRTVDTYFRGTAQFVNHEAVIEVPEDYRIVTAEDGLTVQLTPIGGFAQMYVESQDLNRIVVKSSRDVQFHYLIQGLRRAYKDVAPVQTGYEFMPTSADQKMPAYLSEEAKRRLISNGTYHADGTVNMETAERTGWTRIWQQREEETRTAAEQGARERAMQSSDRQ